jgi:hypothetical protein
MAHEISRPSEAARNAFGVYPIKGKAKAWVHPLGKVGVHVDAADSVLLKAIGMIH